MKKQFLSAKTLMLTALLVVVSGCTIKHKFEQPPIIVNNYYGGGGDGFSGENNTLSTSDLGVGYDITRADPYIWASNSVTGVAVRPKVFTFLPDPDPNQTIDLGKLNRDATRRRKPLGVNVDASPEFTWEEKMDFVSDASDFQTSNGGHVSAGGGAMGVAFSASASYKSSQAKTTKEEKTVASKNGAYKALKMEIDFSTPHQFTKQFRDAVQNLNQNPLTYDTFIYYWGTHFSRVATIGANCAYRMEFKNSALSTKYESEESFKAGVEGSMAGISVEASAGYDQSRMNAIKESTGAESITFVSYGGSGAGINDYPKWTEHAVENPTVIDVYLTPYDSIFTKAFFPKDDLIKTKQELFKKALERYYGKAQAVINTDPLSKKMTLDFAQEMEFKVEMRIFYLKTYPQKFDKAEKIWGDLQLVLLNEGGITQSTTMKSIPAGINATLETAIRVRPGVEIVYETAVPDYKTLYTRTFTLSAQEKNTFWVSLIGRANIDWWGNNPLELLERKGEKNSVKLAGMKVGQSEEKKVEMKYDKSAEEKFNLVVTYAVTRTK